VLVEVNPMQIPVIDLQAGYAAIKSEIDAAVGRVLASGQYIGGPEVEGLEKEFAALCCVEHAVAVGSGTDALRFSLLAAGVGPGDEVITSPFSFIAVTEVISQAGAKPVFADIDLATFNIDPARIEPVLTGRTKAIVPVHLYGQPADMEPILALAERRRLAVIEDACQAHGARHKWRPAGSLGDAGCFSFYPTKNLGGYGEGGIVTTSRADLAAKIRRSRDHGQSEKYIHAEEGYNGRLDALQAAILRVKLKRLGAWNERRRALAERYRTNLRDLDKRGVLTLPAEASWARHVYHLFAVRVAGADRVQAALRERGVATGRHYPIPLHLQPCYAGKGWSEGSFPQAEKAAGEVLTLPLYPEMTEAQLDRVCEAIRDVVGRG
jgi:dTDP-4-amino-4,6-dideoxygalactose transaminase